MSSDNRSTASVNTVISFFSGRTICVCVWRNGLSGSIESAPSKSSLGVIDTQGVFSTFSNGLSGTSRICPIPLVVCGQVESDFSLAEYSNFRCTFGVIGASGGGEQLFLRTRLIMLLKSFSGSVVVNGWIRRLFFLLTVQPPTQNSLKFAEFSLSLEPLRKSLKLRIKFVYTIMSLGQCATTNQQVYSFIG